MRRLAILVAVVLLGSLVALPAAGGGAKVETIHDFDTVVAVGFTEEAGYDLMNAACEFVKRVENPDGSSKETMACQVTTPLTEGAALPEKAFRVSGGECIWYSDYWLLTEGLELYADSVNQIVTPSGKVSVTTTYSPNPPTAEDCGFGGPPPGEG